MNALITSLFMSQLQSDLPGAFPSQPVEQDSHATVNSPQFKRCDSKERVGKFADLTKFMSCPTHTNPETRKYTNVPQARLLPGDIIYVSDNRGTSRINDRVMLFLKNNLHFASITCISFCYHEDDPCRYAKTHRAVQQSGKNPTAVFSSLEPLEAKLICGDCSLTSGITVNLEEIWQVETEVDVLRLGSIEGQEYMKLRKDVISLFKAGMIPDSDPSAPTVSMGPMSGDEMVECIKGRMRANPNARFTLKKNTVEESTARDVDATLEDQPNDQRGRASRLSTDEGDKHAGKAGKGKHYRK